MNSLKCFFTVISLLFVHQSWSQQFEIIGTDATNSSCNGEIQLLYSDIAEDDFTYLWSTGEMGIQNLTELCPGYYTMEIRLKDGCVIELFTQLSGIGCYMELDNFSATIIDYCNKNQLGSIELTSEFGLDYYYSWGSDPASGGPSIVLDYGNGPSITDLNPGSYCVTISPQNADGAAVNNECQLSTCYTVKSDRSCTDRPVKGNNEVIGRPINRDSLDFNSKDPLLIINEFGKGITSGEGYLELLAIGEGNCESIDLRDFIIDDNNGIFSNSLQNTIGFSRGHIRFSDHLIWKSVPVGSLILIYNNENKAETITLPDDPYDDNNDQVYVLPLSHSLFDHYHGFPNPDSPNLYNKNNGIFQVAGDHPSWSSINTIAFADGIQVRFPNGTYGHGISFGDIDLIHGGPDELQLLSTSGENKIFSFNGGDYREQVDYMVHNVEDGTGSPGYPNSDNNQGYIENLCSDNISELVASRRNTVSDFITEIFPNPFSKQFFVNIESKTDQERNIQIKLLNLLNQEILLESYVLLPGENSFTINAPAGLVTGVYQVNIHEKDRVIFSKRMIFNK